MPERPVSQTQQSSQKEAPTQKTDKKLDIGSIVKTALCVLAFLSTATFFSFTCRDLTNNYLLLLTPSYTATVPWLIQLSIASLLLATASGIVAVLVRPLWLTIVVYITGSALAGFVIQPNAIIAVTMIALALFLVTYLLFIRQQMQNQIHYSLHPLSDSKVMFFIFLAIIVSVSFGNGYINDSTRRNYVVPPEVKTIVLNQAVGFTDTVVESLYEQPAQRQVAKQAAQASTKEALDNMEKELAPHIKTIPIVLGVTLFSIALSFFFLLSFLLMPIVRTVFFLLRTTKFAHVTTETREVSRLTLESI